MKKRDNKFTFTLFVLTILFFYIPLVVVKVIHGQGFQQNGIQNYFKTLIDYGFHLDTVS